MALHSVAHAGLSQTGGESKAEAGKQRRLGIVGPDDAAQSHLAVVYERQYDVDALNFAELLENRSGA